VRALLVNKPEEGNKKLECRFVGLMYFYSLVPVYEPNTQVMIANSQGTEIISQDYYKIDSKINIYKGKRKDEHNYMLYVKGDANPPLVYRYSELE
jgi:hypothetical protein